MNHASRHKLQEDPPSKWIGYVLVPLVVVATLTLGPWSYRRWFLPNSSWPFFPARVVATRVARAGIFDNLWGTSFVYRVDVDAVWTENGTQREAWVPTNKRSRNREWLALWASQQGSTCVVRQSPRDPSALLAFF
jgi:hypothetical protein